MLQNAKRFLPALLLASTSSLNMCINEPLSRSSLWITSFIIILQVASAEEMTCTPINSEEGSCTKEELETDEHDEPLRHEEPWEGDPADKPVWWNYDFNELFGYFDCTNILPGYATIFDEGEYILGVDDNTLDPLQIKNLTGIWDEMYTKYKAEVNLSTPGSSREVIVVPAEIGDAGSDKGRGVFVTEKVPKGTLVVNTDSDTIGIFKDGHTWRKFVAKMSPYTACNVMEWSWVQDFQLEDKNDIRNGLTIVMAWDKSNLLNNADWTDSEEDPNIKCGTPPEGWPEKEDGIWGPCQFHYYAIKDLEVGEEILMAYGEFENFFRDWPRMGLNVGDPPEE